MSKAISWDDQRIFLAVFEEGSLTGAARRLGLSHPTVRSRIEALEVSLNTVLFTRSPNGLKPTETALGLLEPARAMSVASDLFVRLASAPSNEIAGTVRISVPEFMGIEVIPAMLRTLRDRHPAIEIELSLSNAIEDVLTREVDLAVRTVAPAQEALVTRKVASIPLGFFAAGSYLKAHGQPETMVELTDHHLIGPDRNRTDLMLAEKIAPNFTRRSFNLRCDSHPAQLSAARAGLGIAVVQIPVGEADPDLVRVLPDITVATLDTWIVMHENLRQVPRIRAVFDSFVGSFRNYNQVR